MKCTQVCLRRIVFLPNWLRVLPNISSAVRAIATFFRPKRCVDVARSSVRPRSSTRSMPFDMSSTQRRVIRVYRTDRMKRCNALVCEHECWQVFDEGMFALFVSYFVAKHRIPLLNSISVTAGPQVVLHCSRGFFRFIPLL